MKYADGVFTVSTVVNIPGLPKKGYTEQQIENAMACAVRDAMAKGFNLDSPEIRKRMKEARRKVTNAGIE